MSSRQDRVSMMRIAAWASLPLTLALALAPVLSAGSAVQPRDQQRLENARQAHQRDLDRAFDQYVTMVERANANLERQYRETIRMYERRNDSEAAERLRRELAELIEASKHPRQFPTRGHQELIGAIGPALVTGNRQRHDSAQLAELDYVLLYFSASWCGPCRRFTPGLVEFYEQYGREGNFAVLLVSRDHSEPDMYRYLRDSQMPFPAIPYARADAFRDHYNVTGIPHVIALDQDGRIVARGQTNVIQTIRDRLARSE